ncbi:MAG: hypothetical protein ACK5XN_00355, partial [Bacteroidota bacterium]
MEGNEQRAAAYWAAPYWSPAYLVLYSQAATAATHQAKHAAGFYHCMGAVRNSKQKGYKENPFRFIT